MLHGVIIGIAAVALVGFIIVGTTSKGKEQTVEKEVTERPQKEEDATTPTSGPNVSVGDPLKLFAKQHGVFSSEASASEFIALDEKLAKASVIDVGGQFYVWSEIGLDESELEVSEAEGTFRKPFFAETSACSSVGAGKLRKALSETELSQIKILSSSSEEDKEDESIADFRKNLVAVTAFSSDLRIVRLKLLSHYTHKNGCVKIKF